MAFTIAATQAAATDGRWPGRGAPSVLGETSAPITVPSGRTRGVIANQGAVVVARKSGTRKFVAWGSTPRPGGRAASETLGYHYKRFWSARTARAPRALELVAQGGGLSAAGRTN